MKITFRVDAVDLFRKGINIESPIVSLDIDPAKLPGDQRKLISKHLINSSNGCSVVHDPQRALQPNEVVPIGGQPGASLIEAENQTLDSLLAALNHLESQAHSMNASRSFCA